MSNKQLSKTPEQIIACCILHNFVQRAEQEPADALIVSARHQSLEGSWTAAPPAFDPLDATARLFPAAADSDNTLAHARALRLDIAKECVAVRAERYAASYRRRVKTAAEQDAWARGVREHIRAAEAADRLAGPLAGVNARPAAASAE
jgi:hypothetical protein